MEISIDTLSRPGWIYVRGVADNPNRSYLLGPNQQADHPPAVGASDVLSDNGSKHYVALYQPTPSTATLRLYFDPPNENENSVADIGYIQFADMWSGNVPLKPDAVSGFASRRDYVVDASSNEMKDDDRVERPPLMFVDFMGPVDAYARFGGTARQVPFYALNAGVSRNVDYTECGKQGMPAGSIRLGDKKRGQPQLWATKASLRLSIRPFQPSELTLERACKQLHPLLDLTATSEIDAKSTFETVKSELAKGVGVIEGHVVDAQAIGSFLLIMLDDDFDNAVLVARISKAGESRGIKVWMITQDSYSGIEQQAVLDAIDKIGSAVVAAQSSGLSLATSARPIPIASKGRAGAKGRARLREPHSIVAENSGRPLLTMNLYSIIYSATQVLKSDRSTETNLVAVSGVYTRLEWYCDGVTGQAYLKFNWSIAKNIGDFWPALRKYADKMKNPPETDRHDESNFLLAGYEGDLAPTVL